VDIENILVVDDEEAIREVVSTMLDLEATAGTAVSNGRGGAGSGPQGDAGSRSKRHDHAGNGRHQAAQLDARA